MPLKGPRKEPKTSSVVICAHCGNEYKNKYLLEKHLSTHEKFTCKICGMELANRGLLGAHMSIKHSGKKDKPKSIDDPKKKYKCDACKTRFLYNCQLKYHVRKYHFNLLTTLPAHDFPVNETWYEKVINTNVVVEIKKVHNNNLLIRRVDQDESVKVTEIPTEVVDLRNLYPTVSDPLKRRVRCKVCFDLYPKTELLKHVMAVHGYKSLIRKNKATKLNKS